MAYGNYNLRFQEAAQSEPVTLWCITLCDALHFIYEHPSAFYWALVREAHGKQTLVFTCGKNF
jgi:hypothetical protein